MDNSISVSGGAAGSAGSAEPLAVCDWLDVTFPADSALWVEVSDLLASLGASAKRLAGDVVEYRFPSVGWGNFRLESSRRGWSRVSASGGSLGHLRASGAFSEYLGLLGSYPSTITRLDAALDLAVPAPPVIQALVSQYPPGSLVYLTRKGVRPSYNLQPLGGSEGFTGTFYAGAGGRAKVSARVYDKQSERLQRAGLVTGDWLRYEVTCRKGVGVTLRDAHDPTALFFHFASPALLPLPARVAPWVPDLGDVWSPGSVKVDPYARLRSRVESSVDLGHLVALADDLPGGRLHLLRVLRTFLGLGDVSIPG